MQSKFKPLILTFGYEGYGLYHAITEQSIRKRDYALIAFNLNTEVEKVRAVIEDFKLFKLDGNKFYLDEKETVDIDYAEVVTLYHRYAPSLSKVQLLTEKRKEKIRARYKEIMKKYPDKDFYRIIEYLFDKAEQSDFCRGINNHNWRASFDWIFENESNWVKILEGKYTNKNEQKASYRIGDAR